MPLGNSHLDFSEARLSASACVAMQNNQSIKAMNLAYVAREEDYDVYNGNVMHIV